MRKLENNFRLFFLGWLKLLKFIIWDSQTTKRRKTCDSLLKRKAYVWESECFCCVWLFLFPFTQCFSVCNWLECLMGSFANNKHTQVQGCWGLIFARNEFSRWKHFTDHNRNLNNPTVQLQFHQSKSHGNTHRKQFSWPISIYSFLFPLSAWIYGCYSPIAECR